MSAKVCQSVFKDSRMGDGEKREGMRKRWREMMRKGEGMKRTGKEGTAGCGRVEHKVVRVSGG